MNNFWQELPKPFFILAPMEAVTDVVFRHVVAQAGRPDIFFTEFTNAASFCSPAGVHSTRGRLTFTSDEQPMVAQIWGTKPEHFEQMSHGLKDMGYKGIDINMGCPDKNVVKGGGGSGLIRTPDLAGQLITAAKASGLPVSVKTRLGYSSPDEWREWLAFLLQQDITNLTIHLRTRKEMSKVPAHFELIPEIKKLRDEIAPHTLLTMNGDIEDRTHGQELVEKYGVDGIMIGRGIFHNPFAFEKTATPHDKAELINLLKLHLDLFDHYSKELEPRRFDPLKRFFKIYIRDFPGASELRASLMMTNSTNEARNLLTAVTPRQVVSNLAETRYHVHMSHNIKCIIFDSDGTLVDTRKLILHGYKTVLGRHGLSHLTTDAYIRSRLGKPVPETYAQLLAEHHPGLAIEQLVAEHNEVQNHNTHLIKPYPETERLLRTWRKKGIKLCLFTSGDKMMIRRNFAAAGMPPIEELFDAVVTADDHLPHKPHPDAINELLRRVGVAPKDTVIVGDHPYDIQSGTEAHAGLKVGILHGFGDTKQLLAAGADLLSDDLSHLNTILQFAD